MRRGAALLILAAWLPGAAVLADLPAGYWPLEKTRPLLDVALRIRLDPDLSHLSRAEHAALAELIAAGHIFNDLYEQQRHAQALSARAELQKLHEASGESDETRNLLDLYYLNKGPIATTLDNERLPFVPVAGAEPGKNVYPGGMTRARIDALMEERPDAAAGIKAERSVVRVASAENIAADLATLDEFPAVDALHHGLRESLATMAEDDERLYAVPFALAYAPELALIRRHLDAAADILSDESPDFAAYLRLRSRDLLSSDYEAGDAAWVSGSFGNINAQLGSYETYDDSLLGTKAFYSASLLVRDEAKSRALEQAVAGLQAIEDALPYESDRAIRANIPVGAYNVVADFGQARGANTATILPNDADHTRKYGRTILIRYNIISNPDIFANRHKRFASVVADPFRDDLTMDGGFERTLWHEIGHYLGVDKAADGRSLDAALGEYADLLEEMKADLVSLFAVRQLRETGYHNDASMRAHYSDGIRRTLQHVQPRLEQPYQNMQLMQFNYFLEHGLIGVDAESGLLTIDYEGYHATVTDLLARVLELQRSGDRESAIEFVNRWNYWNESLHGELAFVMRQQMDYRRTLVRYAALD